MSDTSVYGACNGPFMPTPGFRDLYGPLQCEQHGVACPSCEVRDSWSEYGPAEVERARVSLARLWAAADKALEDYPDTETVRQQIAHHALIDVWAALRDDAESLAGEVMAAIEERDRLRLRVAELESSVDDEPDNAVPIGHCPVCGAAWYTNGGFCGGCRE